MAKKSKTNVVHLSDLRPAPPADQPKSDEQLVLAMRVAHAALLSTVSDAEKAGLNVLIRSDRGGLLNVEGVTVDATRVVAPRP